MQFIMRHSARLILFKKEPKKIIKCYADTMSKDTTEKLKRLTAILNRLDTQKRKSLTTDELAKECSVSCRTIFRDLALLKEVGIELNSYNGDYYLHFDFSLKKLGLTSQTAATLCIAYEAAKQTGEEFAPSCQYIRRLFSLNKDLYEINPKLPLDSIIFRLQKAIKEKRYTKIVLDNRLRYIKPYCLVQRQGVVYLVFASTFWKRSRWGYELDTITVKEIKDVSFEAKSKRVKNGRFAHLGVPKHEIDFFIWQHFK